MSAQMRERIPPAQRNRDGRRIASARLQIRSTIARMSNISQKGYDMAMTSEFRGVPLDCCRTNEGPVIKYQAARRTQRVGMEAAGPIGTRKRKDCCSVGIGRKPAKP